jgi:hypothetical protein
MAISQRSIKVAFMLARRGVKKNETERDVIHLRPSRAVRVGCLDSIIMLLQSVSAVFHCLCRIFFVFLQRKENYISTVNNLNNSN